MLNIIVLLILLVGSISWSLAEPNNNAPPHLDGKIVGGNATVIDNYPYQVSVLHHGLHVCGGTLLDYEWIITAAHCVEGSLASTLSIRLGSTFRNIGGEVIKTSFKHIHPKYNNETLSYDIAVLKLIDKAPSNNPSIESIGSLAAFWQEGKATVTGWGSTEETGGPSLQLRYVEVDLIDKEKCDDLYGNNLITDTMICAGVLPSGGMDACHGDSGGPLVVHDAIDRSTTLVGVVSWGYGCARPNYPGVYSGIAKLGDWIMSVVVPRLNRSH